MPTPATEIAVANRAVSLTRRVFGRRKVLRNQRQDLDALFGEVMANLDAVRATFRSGAFDRWAWRATTLATTLWRRLAYPLTNLVDGPVIDRELADELDALADEFERAQRQTLFNSSWEPRLVAVALELRTLIAEHPRRRLDKLFLGRPRAESLPRIDATIVTPATPVEMQLRALRRMREPESSG